LPLSGGLTNSFFALHCRQATPAIKILNHLKPAPRAEGLGRENVKAITADDIAGRLGACLKARAEWWG
jgi:hypothetical protein